MASRQSFGRVEQVNELAISTQLKKKKKKNQHMYIPLPACQTTRLWVTV